LELNFQIISEIVKIFMSLPNFFSHLYGEKLQKIRGEIEKMHGCLSRHFGHGDHFEIFEKKMLKPNYW
jgi:hypothetical protein